MGLLSKASSSGLGQLNKQSPFSSQNQFGRGMKRQGPNDSLAEMATDTSDSGHKKPIIEESLAQKKQRLFKWNDYQNI